MAVTKITCPECDAVLKPAKPLTAGKRVKCPKCGHAMTVLDDEPEPAPRKKPKADGTAGIKKKSADKRVAEKKAPAKPPEKAPAKASHDDDDDGGGTYGVIKEEKDEEGPAITYTPDTSIKDLRGPAQAAVVKPTNFVILMGALGFFGWLIFLIILLIPVCFPLSDDDSSPDKENPKKIPEIGKGVGAAADKSSPIQDSTDKDKSKDKGGKKKPGSEDEEPSLLTVFGIDFSLLALYPWYTFVAFLLPIIACMAYAGTVIMGAVKAQNLESRQWGVASSIMVMIPFNIGGLALVLLICLNILLGMLMDDESFMNTVLIVFAVIFCLIEIGVGVVALMTFQKPEVIEGYEYREQK
jgi:hypothetical protein